MSNTFNVHSIIAAEAQSVIEEGCPFLMNVNRARESDFKTNFNGYHVGSSVTVSIPARGSVFTTSTLWDGGAAEDFQETTATLTIDQHRHAAIAVNVSDSVFKLDATDPRRADYRKRVLKPQLSSLCASIEASLLSKAVNATPNLVGTAGAVPSTMLAYNQARAKMANYLAPGDDQMIVYSTDSNVALVDASKALFHDEEALRKQYKESYIGRAIGANWFEAVNLPSITIGSDVTGATINGASQTGSTMTVAGLSSAPTEGTVFTIAGVYAVHPLTGTAYGTTLQQFVVGAGATTTSLPISPAIKATFPNKTVSAGPADTAAIVFVGSASTAYRQNLRWQKDAYTAAFFPVPVVAGAEGYVLTDNGISITAQTGGSITTLASTTRIDVMWGFCAPYPLWGCRITE